MPWGDKAVSPVVYTPAAADASGWELDANLILETGKVRYRPAFPSRSKLLFEFMADDINSSTITTMQDTSGLGNHIANRIMGSSLSLYGSGADRYVHFDKSCAFSRTTVGAVAIAFLVARINTDTVVPYAAMADSDNFEQFIFGTVGDGSWFNTAIPKYINGVSGNMPMKQKVLVHAVSAWTNIYVGCDRIYTSRAPDFNLYALALYTNLSADEVSAVKAFVSSKYGLAIS